MGLGLSICKKIVETFDGDIHLDQQDEGEVGVSFTFTIKCSIKKKEEDNG